MVSWTRDSFTTGKPQDHHLSSTSRYSWTTTLEKTPRESRRTWATCGMRRPACAIQKILMRKAILWCPLPPSWMIVTRLSYAGHSQRRDNVNMEVNVSTLMEHMNWDLHSDIWSTKQNFAISSTRQDSVTMDLAVPTFIMRKMTRITKLTVFPLLLSQLLTMLSPSHHWSGCHPFRPRLLQTAPQTALSLATALQSHLMETTLRLPLLHTLLPTREPWTYHNIQSNYKV